MRNDELFLLVGKLNYAWTNTESLLIYLLAFIMGTRKEVAIVTFLTLNTSRARLDLIERLLRLQSTSPDARERLLPVLGRMRGAARIRNNYNHSIYSFDENGEIDSTQLMRIADHGNTVRYGKIQTIDAEEIKNIEGAISEIVDINKAILEFVSDHNITY
jgi:hypothetical protein